MPGLVCMLHQQHLGDGLTAPGNESEWLMPPSPEDLWSRGAGEPIFWRDQEFE